VDWAELPSNRVAGLPERVSGFAGGLSTRKIVFFDGDLLFVAQWIQFCTIHLGWNTLRLAEADK
jgi:hypothetical protein